MPTSQADHKRGPLLGLKVIEFAGLGPAPFAGMLLADLGADVWRIERSPDLDPLFDPSLDLLQRGKHWINLDLKQAEGRRVALTLCQQADVVIEGFRPGVLERLGLGPEVLLAAKPDLIVGRMTGWGQSGPWASRVGHDINYLAVSGALHAMGRATGGPVPPLNLVADFGGGAMLLVVGILAALQERARSGLGQVVDAAMVDGCGLLMNMVQTLTAMGQWGEQRQSNLLDGGAPFYDTYACADGEYMAVGCIEAAFYQAFLRVLGWADDPFMQAQHDRAQWPAQKARIAAALASRPRADWLALFEPEPLACVSPVLSLSQAAHHEHLQARAIYGLAPDRPVPMHEAAAAPRFGRTPGQAGRSPKMVDAQAWAAWGLDAASFPAT